MKPTESIVAVFPSHDLAESAVKNLAQSGFDMRTLSVVGHGYHSNEQVIGFYNIGDRVQFWGARGAFWGALWGLMFGGIFVTAPLTGPVIVLGSLAAAVVAAVEGAVVLGGISALGAALASIGVPNNSVIDYETAIVADGYLVIAQGSAEDVARAKAILAKASPSRIEGYVAPAAPLPVAVPA